MGTRIDHFRKALASGKLKLTAAILSALGVSMTTSCLPVAMYMPPPPDPVTVSGVVRNSADSQPVKGIAVLARLADQDADALGADFTDAEGAYAITVDVGYASGDVEFIAADLDGAENGGTFQQGTATLMAEELAGDADGQMTLDIDLDPEPTP